MAVSQRALYGAPGMGSTGVFGSICGVPFSGLYTGLNANAMAASTDNQVPLYEPGSTVLITLAAADQVVITDIAAMGAVNMQVRILGGGSTVTTGEIVATYNITTTGSNCITQRLAVPHYCAPGAFPRVLTSSSGLVEVTLHGYVTRN